MLLLAGATHVAADDGPAEAGAHPPATLLHHHPSLFEQIVHLGAKPHPVPVQPTKHPNNDGDGDAPAAAADDSSGGDTPAEKEVRRRLSGVLMERRVVEAHAFMSSGPHSRGMRAERRRC